MGHGEDRADADIGARNAHRAERGQRHALRALSDVHLIEVQIGRTLEEDDIEQFEWTW